MFPQKFIHIIRWFSILAISVVIFVIICEWMSLQHVLKEDSQLINKQSLLQQESKTDFKFYVTLKDWHDVEAMSEDAIREGIGEQGRPSIIRNVKKQKLKHLMAKQNGFNALLSDLISVNRSVADIRFDGCQSKKYFANLPSASIVIPFYNEHFSTLVRSVHSLVNRSPPELLREIILVDDFSDRKELKKQLDDYVRIHFPKVEIIRFRKRGGLIAARLAGAVKAVGDVLVFMDSHVEANYNWLPPLLHQIALDNHTVVCPMIDVIDDETFEYHSQDDGARGAFDWNFDYKRLELLDSNMKDRTQPFESPIMAGGLFAISREWFWELGGYDEGLEIWGGEQYELSFKIWMCGGRLLDVPCSRVGHIFRNDKWSGAESDRDDDYLHKNYKRVAEVWMDDYKRYIYKHAHGLYEQIDAGDLTEQRELREKLHCKSFKWFMENVAFDLVKEYPPRGTTDFAFGQVRSVGAANLCLDTLGPPDYSAVGLYECEQFVRFPSRFQDWSLSEDRDLRMRGEDYCLQALDGETNAAVLIYDCHIGDEKQLWYYHRKTQWLVYGRNRNLCLEARPDIKRVVVNRCSRKNLLMKWTFVHVNDDLLDKYFKKL